MWNKHMVCIYDTYNLYVFTQVTPENGIYEVEHNFMKLNLLDNIFSVF